MSDENKTPEEQPAEATPETAAAEQPEAVEAAGVDPIEVLKAENADLKDRALRVMAEMETCAAARKRKSRTPASTPCQVLPVTC